MLVLIVDLFILAGNRLDIINYFLKFVDKTTDMKAIANSVMYLYGEWNYYFALCLIVLLEILSPRKDWQQICTIGKDVEVKTAESNPRQ